MRAQRPRNITRGLAVARLLCRLGQHSAAGVVADLVEDVERQPLRLAQVALAYAGPAEEDAAGEAEPA